MGTLTMLALYWAVFFLFYWIASQLRHKELNLSRLEQLMTVMIVILVFLMGLRMGANEEVTSNLDTIGIQSVLITVTVVGGSVLSITFLRKLMGLNKEGMPKGQEIGQGLDCPAVSFQAQVEDETEAARPKDSSGVGMSVLIFSFVIFGLLLGYLVIPRLFKDLEIFQAETGNLLTIGICILLALAGFNLGISGKVVESLKSAGLRVILFPFAAVGGSLLGGLVYGLLSPLSIREAVAISAGFGWYTLAPTIITEAGFAVAGAISFMHNVIREVFGLVIIPIAAKKIGYLEVTGIPGVSAMDVCIPLIEKSCRAETIVYSFLIGALMNFSVPILVPLIIG